VNRRKSSIEEIRAAPYLKHFGVSLNRQARLDKISATIGREKEIQQIIEILCHRERANFADAGRRPGRR
jgi:ATP-dependent Clp protease ATP-binding subunit ClpA